jgi:hypothetical protein
VYRALGKVPALLGKSVRKQMTASAMAQIVRSWPSGVISSCAGNSSPPRKKVAIKPHTKLKTLPVIPPTPSAKDVKNDRRPAIRRPSTACAIRPPSKRPAGSRFKDVTTIPAKHLDCSAEIIHIWGALAGLQDIAWRPTKMKPSMLAESKVHVSPGFREISSVHPDANFSCKV